jgi:hypothetical protein
VTDSKTVLQRLRNLLANTAERRVMPGWREEGSATRVVLAPVVTSADVRDLLIDLDALITGVEANYLATDREEATRQVCALSDTDVRALLVDYLARPRGTA